MMAKRIEVTYRPKTVPRGKERFEWNPPEDAADVVTLKKLLTTLFPEIEGPNLVTDIRILAIRRDWRAVSTMTDSPSADIYAVVLVTCDGQHVNFRRASSVEGVYEIRFSHGASEMMFEVYPFERCASPSIVDRRLPR